MVRSGSSVFSIKILILEKIESFGKNFFETVLRSV